MSVSASETSRTTLNRRLDPELLLLFSAALFGLTVRNSSPGGAVAAIVATGALGAVIARRTIEISDLPDERRERRFLAGLLLFSLLGFLGWAPSTFGPTSVWLERMPSLAWAALGLTLFFLRRRADQRRIATGITMTAVLLSIVVGALHLNAIGGLGLDVNLLHTRAAEAIANGDNPYTDSVVVPDGSPLADPGDEIVGYPYPPVTAITYALGEWTFSDPRYTSLAAWALVLGLLGLFGARQGNRAAVYAMLLLAALPGWPLVLRGGWTEPVTLAFVVGAFLMWSRPTGSGFQLGLALASKQYFVVTAPLALLHRDPGWLKRLVVAGFVVTLTVGAAMVLDFDAFWSAAVEFHSSTPPRPDSSNIVGLLSSLGIAWAPTTVVGLSAGLLAAVAAGRLSTSRNTFVLAMAFTLAVSFLVSTQAFANYWFLVTGLCVLAIVAPPSDSAAQLEP